MPRTSRGSGTQHLHRASERYRQAVRRKLAAYHRHIQVGVIAQELLQTLAIQHASLVWSSFGSWLRTRYAISDDAALDALNRLSAAGLISAKRGRGRFATVTLHLDDEAPLAAA